jgi:hypothetical protein
MAAKLSDAKITVRLDTEAADEKLTKIEGKLKKDEKAIKAVEKKQKGKKEAGFILEHTGTMLEIGTVKARLAKTIRDVSNRNLGSSVAKTFKTFMGS